MATIGEVKEQLQKSLACNWLQWTNNKLRLQEADKLCRKQRKTWVWFRDDDPMVELGGKGKKKKEALDDLKLSLEGPLAQGEVLRFNILFQLLALQVEMLAIIRGTEGFLEVWRDEVQELLNWNARGGQLEMGEEDEGEPDGAFEEEDVQGGPPEEGEMPVHKQRVDEQEVAGRGGLWKEKPYEVVWLTAVSGKT